MNGDLMNYFPQITPISLVIALSFYLRICVICGLPSHCPHHRLENLHVAGAAAEIAGQAVRISASFGFDFARADLLPPKPFPGCRCRTARRHIQ